MNKLKAVFLSLFGLAVGTFSPDELHAQIRSYPIFEVQTIGQSALAIGKSKTVFFDMQALLLDATKKTFPPDATSYDRSLLAQIRVGYSHPVSGRVSIRSTLDVFGGFRKEHTESEPRNVTIEEAVQYRPALDVTLTTNSGIEVVLGAAYTHAPEYFGNTESSVLAVDTRFAEYNIIQPRIAFIKRGGFGQGGFYFQSGVQVNRDVEVSIKDSTEPTRVSSEAIRQPTTLGIVMKFGGSGTQWLGEFQAVQAGQGGEKKEDSGKTVQEDYNTLSLGMNKKVGPMMLTLNLKHKTLSYATSNDVRLDLIPISVFDAGIRAGSDTQYLYAKLLLAYGKDVQSTEEFNQEFIAQSFGISAGFRFAL